MSKHSTRPARLRLDKLLVERGLSPSREAAREAIERGRVCVAGFVHDKPASQVSPDAAIEVSPAPGTSGEQGGGDEWVSRGAYKLLKGLDAWAVDLAGARCIDIGASTGGFTQVMLRRGAARVAAVDVGYGQLAWALRNDPRVEVFERTNARYLTPEDIGWRADFLTVDASFISLRLLLPALEKLIGENGLILALVKPQFEVGRAKVGKGIVRDPALHLEVLNGLHGFACEKTGLRVRGASFSPIRGPEGNIEFIFLMAPADSPEGLELYESPDFDKLVAEAHESLAK